MNIITDLIARIEGYRATNKQPCKNYSTQEMAEKATKALAIDAGKYFDREGREANYLVLYVEPWGRWVGAINLSELVQRKTSIGGYLGMCSARGFFTF